MASCAPPTLLNIAQVRDSNLGCAPRDGASTSTESSAATPLKLSREERKGVLSGSLTKLSRPKKPSIEAGDTQIVQWSRGGTQFLARSHQDREKRVENGEPLTVEIPREPTVWITFREPQLRDGEWELPFTLHDEREPVRTLSAGAPSGVRHESGLKTRWRPPAHVPSKDKQRQQLESFTPESERGYGGKDALEAEAGVDDATLDDFSRRVAEENELRRKHNRHDASKMRSEMALASEYRKGKSGKLRRAAIERQERRLAA